jgi:beta-lactamase class A
MQSVYKFHLALAVLDRVDRGEWSLDQRVSIKRDELMVKTWSPMRDDHPDGNFEISLRELLRYTVALSDNNGCDVLFRLIGGTKKVDAYIKSLGVTDVAIAATEEEMHADWAVQFTNWTTPLSAALLLKKFNAGEILSDSATLFLRRVMEGTSTGPNRIRGLLPAGTVVANKTGTSGPDDEGISAATNDIGIVSLPDGRQFTIAVFVTESRETHEVNERIIAEVTKAVWDYYTGSTE